MSSSHARRTISNYSAALASFALMRALAGSDSSISASIAPSAIPWKSRPWAGFGAFGYRAIRSGPYYCFFVLPNNSRYRDGTEGPAGNRIFDGTPS
jgi:hypothetical protein